jgi:hypothetical protein
MVQHEWAAMIDALFAFGGSVLYEFGGAAFCIACSSVMVVSPFFYVMEGKLEGKGIWHTSLRELGVISRIRKMEVLALSWK